jgi:hypothetical protein
MGIVRHVTHDFYMKPHTRQKSGDAVARSSDAPVRMHCPKRHAGINTWRIIARIGGIGGGVFVESATMALGLPLRLDKRLF